jgi:hypothetical protein
VKNLVFLFAFISMSSACTWVKVNEDATRVAVTDLAHVTNCEKVRNVNVKVKASVGPMDRSSTKVATELATLARNEAINFGGDTVAPTSEIRDGRQSFGVYKCK